jgi:hypothetical protein
MIVLERRSGAARITEGGFKDWWRVELNGRKN